MVRRASVIAHVVQTADSLESARTHSGLSKATPADLADLDAALSRVDEVVARLTETQSTAAVASPLHAGDTSEGHEGATDAQVGDRIGPGAGYDDEPEQVKDKGGVVS